MTTTTLEDFKAFLQDAQLRAYKQLMASKAQKMKLVARSGRIESGDTLILVDQEHFNEAQRLLRLVENMIEDSQLG